MKRLFCLFLVLVIILATLIGCSKVEYRIYYSLSAKSSKPPSEISGIPIKEDYALFGDVMTQDGDENDSNNTIIHYIDEDAPKLLEIQIGEIKYEMTYRDSSQNVFSRSENPNIKKLGYRHHYEQRDKEGKIIAGLTVFKDNFKILSFGYYGSENADSESSDQVKTQLTEETATKFIENELKRLYSKDVFEQYNHTTGVWYNENEEEFECWFTRTVQGFKTDDRIIITVDKYGRITGINAQQVGMFVGLTDKISERQIVKAALTLEKTVETDVVVVTSEEIYLAFDIHGKLYVRAMVSDINEKREVYATAIYFINVN